MTVQLATTTYLGITITNEAYWVTANEVKRAVHRRGGCRVVDQAKTRGHGVELKERFGCTVGKIFRSHISPNSTIDYQKECQPQEFKTSAIPSNSSCSLWAVVENPRIDEPL